MRLRVEATDRELVAREAQAHQLVDDLVAAAACRCGGLAKGGPGPATTPLDRVVARLRRQWLAGYRRQMTAMLADLKAKMATMESTLPAAERGTGGGDAAV